MICADRQPSVAMTASLSSSIRLIALERPPLTEYFLTVLPTEGTTTAALLDQVARTLRERHATIVSQEIFASVDGQRSIRQTIARSLGR
ncbi:MAG: hypothetical protein JSW27_01105, partial [Phycisphaerales bacterium]